MSGEGVAYELTHAGVGSRTVAAGIDLIIQLVALIVLLLLDVSIAGAADAAAVAALSVVEIILVFAGYPIVLEWLTRGRTVGKLCMGLRVVRDDGGPIGFRQALVRGLAGLILEKPGLLAPITTAVGLGTMMLSSADKRLGDMMAGTFVLNERAGSHRATAARDFTVPYELQPWATALDLSRLDDQLALAVRQFVVRAHEMTPAAQVALGEQLRAAVLAVIAPAPPSWAPTPAVLVALLAERRRRGEALLAGRARPTAGPGQVWPPQPPVWTGGRAAPGGPAPGSPGDAGSPFTPPS